MLWLNPGPDPARKHAYVEKLGQARDWLFNESDLADHPDKGFSVLGVDYSEHAASRFKGGVVGWFEPGGGADAWSRAVAEMVFSLEQDGEVSEVIERDEGIFLVRLMERKPAVTRSFESAKAQLEQQERARLRKQLEDEFEQAIEERYPIR